jgi:hypothetical protein
MVVNLIKKEKEEEEEEEETATMGCLVMTFIVVVVELFGMRERRHCGLAMKVVVCWLVLWRRW